MRILVIMLLSANLLAQSMDVKVQDIEIIGHKEGSSLLDFIPSVVKLQGQELQKQRDTSLGDTLDSQAGVSSTQFGPSTSRPVIRGLDGARIRVLQNSLGTLDASTQSVDHAVSVDTLTLDSIEIVRGPMSLLYGSSAVGGVVNLVTNRIHHEYEAGLHSQILTQGESVNNGVSSGMAFDYGSSKWMFHIDGSTRNLQNQDVPKNKELENSFNKQDSLAGGVSKVFDRGSLGISYNVFETNYGTVAEEDVTIDLKQNRYELHGEYRPYGSMFSKIRLRSAYSDYVHQELEGDEVGTVFKNKGNETRLEFLNSSNLKSGVSGLQVKSTNFKASGDEAFLPESDNQDLALFTYQEFSQNKNTFSFGLRLENSKIEKKESIAFGDAQDKDFTQYSSSLGYLYKLDNVSSISTSFSYTQRAPNFQELFSNGAHVATGTFEVGDNSLDKENAYALEVSYKRQTKNNTLTASVYTQLFKDFIFLSPTGNTDAGSGFDIFNYDSVDARFYGFDLENKNLLTRYNSGDLNLTTRLDYVVAKNTDSGDYLPRISPARVGLALEYIKDSWTTDLEVQHALRQNNSAPNESETDSYTLTNIGYSYNIFKETYGVNLFARVKNIFDVEARNHVSVIKDIAPLAGRNFLLGAQVQF